MRTLCSRLLLCICLGLAVITTNGQTVSFTVRDSSTNHTYAFVSGFPQGSPGLTFQEASDFARSFRYADTQQGYLLTITSTEEQTFVSTNSFLFFRGSRGGAWMGGQRDNNLQWRWINGPETGQRFSDNATCVSFCNWATDGQGEQLEPNNINGNESALLWLNNGTPVYSSVPGQWNDYNPNDGAGLIIEFGGISPLDPGIISDQILNTSATNISFSQGVSFPKSDLTHQIYPRDLPSEYTRFSFASLIEYDYNSGAPVTEFDLASAFYVANSKTPAENSVGFSFQVAPLPVYRNESEGLDSYLLVTFLLEEQVGATPFTINAASFPCTLKWSLSVVGWPFKDLRNTLQLSVDLEASPSNPITSISSPTTTTVTTSGTPTATFTITTRTTKVGVSVPLQATIDTNLTALPQLFSISNNNRLLFTFPAFQQSLSYDPTIGVIYGGSSDDSENNDDALIIGLTVGLIGGAIVVVVVVLLVGVFAGGFIKYYGKALLNRDFLNKNGGAGDVL